MENRSLVLDLVEWVAQCPRPYEEVMDAWRTSCPRLTIWEDAVDAGFVQVSYKKDAGQVVRSTSIGCEFLRSNGR